ncbi:MAG: hypothetical protein QXP27_02110, partial [Candidatus Methanomethyliaceae archaeon]
IERDGVTYLVVGGGGAELYRLSSARIDGSLVGFSNWYFYVAVRAEAQGICVRVMGVAEVRAGEIIPKLELLDSFTLPWD